MEKENRKASAVKVLAGLRPVSNSTSRPSSASTVSRVQPLTAASASAISLCRPA